MDIHNCLETSLYQLKSIVKFLVTLRWQEFSTVAPSYSYSQLSFHKGAALFPFHRQQCSYLEKNLEIKALTVMCLPLTHRLCAHISQQSRWTAAHGQEGAVSPLNLVPTLSTSQEGASC